MALIGGSQKLRCLFSLFRHNTSLQSPVKQLTTQTRRKFERIPHQETLRRWIVAKCTSEVCWNCHEMSQMNAVTCRRCNVLLPPNIITSYFSTFGLEDSYDLNLQDLARRFRELQKRFHPDKFSRKSEVEQGHSLQYSSVLNSGYRLLCNPFERGLHLLELKGEPLEETEIQMENEFLLKILELNEELADEVTADRLQSIKLNTEEAVAKLSSNISADFKTENFAAVKRYLSEMKYHVNVLNKVREIERDRGVVN